METNSDFIKAIRYCDSGLEAFRRAAIAKAIFELQRMIDHKLCPQAKKEYRATFGTSGLQLL